MKPKIVFPILTAVIIAIIWAQSMMPGELSSIESGFVSDFIDKLFNLKETTPEYAIRKLAHFTEYAVLGIMIAIDTVLFTKHSYSPYSIIAGIFVPSIDETIQLFTYGRSGSLLDVWLDFSGFVTGFICCGILIKMVHAYKKNKV